MKVSSFQELYVDQLNDLYSAEQQIIKALPKMIEAAQSDELRNALNEHLDVTREQAKRLESIFEQMDESPESEKCKGMEGVLKEGSDLLGKVKSEDIRDAAIIAAAQRVEHYEMAGYGTARTFANLLGEEEAAGLLEETLNEEKEADQKLSELAEQLNVEAMEEAEGEEVEEGEEAQAGARRASSAGKTQGKKSTSRGRRVA